MYDSVGNKNQHTYLLYVETYSLINHLSRTLKLKGWFIMNQCNRLSEKDYSLVSSIQLFIEDRKAQK
jgi:hypothetical protein